MEIDKSYRERRVQLNKPVQCGGNGNITEKDVKSCPYVNTREGALCKRDLTPLTRRYTPALCVLGGGREGEATTTPIHLNREMASASTFSKTPASYVSSSLTTRVSLLKSAADVVKYTDVDYATGSFCSSCSIPPPTAGGL